MDDEPRAAWAEDVQTHRPMKGRRWRISDPRIPEPLRQRLVDELMSARRAVGAATDDTAERAARDRVQDAKVALGERGLRWWTADPEPDAVDDRIRRTARALGRTDPGDGSVMADVAAVVSCDLDRVTAVVGPS